VFSRTWFSKKVVCQYQEAEIRAVGKEGTKRNHEKGRSEATQSIGRSA